MSKTEWARMRLSMAVSSRKYLGKWYRDPKALEKAKANNSAEQEECRAILRAASPHSTSYYYREAPTLGNKFRLGNRCFLTGLDFEDVQHLSVESRMAIGRGECSLGEVSA